MESTGRAIPAASLSMVSPSHPFPVRTRGAHGICRVLARLLHLARRGKQQQAERAAPGSQQAAGASPWLESSRRRRTDPEQA